VVQRAADDHVHPYGEADLQVRLGGLKARLCEVLEPTACFTYLIVWLGLTVSERLYQWALRPALFALDAERAHDLIIGALQHRVVQQALQQGGRPTHDTLRQQTLGLTFAHPIGLGAGLDKQGAAVGAWAALGFSFAEVGTVTPRPQPGNPRPRLFRLLDDRAIINRFGFNSLGAANVARNLSSAPKPTTLRLGINLGKNKETPNDRAADDYVAAAETLRPFADYFVVNVSSPNTAGLRDLQESRALRHILAAVAAAAGGVPVLVKVSPDMTAADLLQSVDAALEGGAAGVIATNTTLARDGLRTQGAAAAETGGLRGAPLRGAANDACRLLFRHLRGRVPIVGSGGVFTADDAYERIRAGATLVQIYTGLIYDGPGMVGRIVGGLDERLRRDGFANIREAIGVDVE
jgi:dihydroorotate dehydrogenase